MALEKYQFMFNIISMQEKQRDRLNYIQRLLFIILIVCLPILVASSKNSTTGNQKELRVAALVEPPFIYFDSDKNLAGPVIFIFKKAALENGWKYKFYPVTGDVNTTLKAVADKKYDMLIGPISVNYERINKISFGRPFYLAQEKLAIHRHSASPLKAFSDFLHSVPFRYLIYILLLMMIIAHIIWLSERFDHREIPRGYFRGVLYSFWIFLAHFFKGGLLYRPSSLAARFVLVIWLIIALSIFLVVTSTYTAYVTARLVATKQSLDDINDLRGVKLAYIRGQEYDTFPKKVGAIGIPVSSMKKALELVENRQVFGALGGDVIMESALADLHTSDVVISNMVLMNNEYAFVFPVGSPHLRPVNLTIVKMQDDGQMLLLCKTYFGDRYLNCEL